MKKPRLLVFASGSKTGGGSGFEQLVESARCGILNADIVGVVSNHLEGGLRQRAKRLNINFIFHGSTWEADIYRNVVESAGADFVALSGWLKLVKGLDPRTTFNIHPGPLPEFGGPGMYGHHVHEAVLYAHKRGEISHSHVSMHFVTEEYDKGPIFFRYPVNIEPTDSADELGSRVNRFEHQFQPVITNLVVNGEISWDGTDPQSLSVPSGYRFHWHNYHPSLDYYGE